jgi:hypothetical protein
VNVKVKGESMEAGRLCPATHIRRPADSSSRQRAGGSSTSSNRSSRQPVLSVPVPSLSGGRRGGPPAVSHIERAYRVTRDGQEPRQSKDLKDQRDDRCLLSFGSGLQNARSLRACHRMRSVAGATEAVILSGAKRREESPKGENWRSGIQPRHVGGLFGRSFASFHSAQDDMYCGLRQSSLILLQALRSLGSLPDDTVPRPWPPPLADRSATSGTSFVVRASARMKPRRGRAVPEMPNVKTCPRPHAMHTRTSLRWARSRLRMMGGGRAGHEASRENAYDTHPSHAIAKKRTW